MLAWVLAPEEAIADGRPPAAGRRRPGDRAPPPSSSTGSRLADESIVAQAAELHESGVRIRTLSLFYDQWLGKLPLSELERVSLLFDIGELHRARYGRIKRIVDTSAAAVGAASCWPRSCPSSGWATGSATGARCSTARPGWARAAGEFEILKFRTMTPAGAGPGDRRGPPRTTPASRPFGAWLRRTHLDELPQVVNILRGDLSVVGPRPEQPRYVEELEGKIPFYRLRHLVRPGLTGWAQVKYPYGASEGDALEKLQYEFYYLRHQSLALDLRITGRTLRSIVRKEGPVNEQPTVTVAIPVLNEEKHIGACLDAIEAQTYPGIVEILVVDGGSTDATRSLVEDRPGVRLLHNPRRIQAAALNIALAEAKGDIFVRVDGHCLIAADYVERCVDALVATGAAMVGGAMTPVADGPTQRGIAAGHGVPDRRRSGPVPRWRSPELGRHCLPGCIPDRHRLAGGWLCRGRRGQRGRRARHPDEAARGQ